MGYTEIIMQTSSPTPESPSASRMDVLYDCLDAIGYDKGFVTRRILPDWWNDIVGETASGYAHATGLISAYTGIGVSSLYGDGALTPLRIGSALGIARRVRGLCFAVTCENHDSQILMAPRDVSETHSEIASVASAFRREILKEGGEFSLSSILEYCGERGVVVVPVAELPICCPEIISITMFISDEDDSGDGESRHLIFLFPGDGRNCHHLFNLAHCLGHISLWHLEAGGEILDEVISGGSDNDRDRAANRFAAALIGSDVIPEDGDYGVNHKIIRSHFLKYIDFGELSDENGDFLRRITGDD